MEFPTLDAAYDVYNTYNTGIPKRGGDIVTQSLAVREHGFAKWVFDIRHDVIRSPEAYELFTDHMEQLKTSLSGLRLDASIEPIVLEGAEVGVQHTGDAGDNFNVVVAMIGNSNGPQFKVPMIHVWIALLGIGVENDEDASRDCGFFKWLDAKTTDEISLHSEANSGFVKQPEIYADFEELISCVAQMKEIHQAAMTKMKEDHNKEIGLLKEDHSKEIDHLKEVNWKQDLELTYIRRKLDIHTVLFCHGGSIIGLLTSSGSSSVLLLSSLDGTCKVWNLVIGYLLQTHTFSGNLLQTHTFSGPVTAIVLGEKANLKTTYQGRFAFSDFSVLNLPDQFRSSFDFIDGYNKPVKGRKINWMKAGILESIKTGFFGIVNGMDIEEWNPWTDKYSSVNYDAATVSEAKALMKENLQIEFGLPVDRSVPLIGFIRRFEEQKGSDILVAAISQFIEEDVQMVVFGTSKTKMEKQIEALEVFWLTKEDNVADCFDDSSIKGRKGDGEVTRGYLPGHERKKIAGDEREGRHAGDERGWPNRNDTKKIAGERSSTPRLECEGDALSLPPWLSGRPSRQSTVCRNVIRI
ncbi:hypothetical protein ACLOJK_005784 [Asimina triloba]